MGRERVAPAVGETAAPPHGAPFRFDDQAASFDARTGLAAAVPAIVAALLAASDAAGPGSTGWLVELGAGTGEIGAALAAASGHPYVGLDLALPMLSVARRRADGTAAARGARWLAADADRPWPLAGGVARLLFVSRAAHLLRPQHLLAEVGRLATPQGAVLALGRVARGTESRRAALQRELQRLLATEGLRGRRGAAAHQGLLDTLVAAGGAVVSQQIVARWPVEERVADALAAWRAKPGLAGLALPAAVRDRVLDRLARWAAECFGDPARRWPSEEGYELAVVRLPAVPTMV